MASRTIKFLEDIKEELNTDPARNKTSQQQNTQGFILPPTSLADANGLPTMRNVGRYTGRLKRNIISWLVPNFGLIKMYINPELISYSNNKIIKQEQTKGGFTLQYWGEDLEKLKISGTTGASGVEGINLLHEIYRAEQYTFDGTALGIANANAAPEDLISKGVDSIFSGVDKGLGFLGAGSKTVSAGLSLAAGLTNQALGGNSQLAPKVIPSLAQNAFTVEMFYDGVVRRGYFTNFNVTESADNYLWKYDFDFVVTQKRGYRTNYFPWHQNPNHAPSADNPESSYSAYGPDYSFNKEIK
jgi:hypothetical protein